MERTEKGTLESKIKSRVCSRNYLSWNECRSTDPCSLRPCTVKIEKITDDTIFCIIFPLDLPTVHSFRWYGQLPH